MAFFRESNIAFRALRKSLTILFGLLPVDRKKLVFDNFGGKGFGDDPKYIAQELLRRDPSLKIYWLIKGKQDGFPKEIRTVPVGSIRANYHFCTAAVWVDNIKNLPKPRKRANQFYLQTWHSTLGFKKNEADAPTLEQNYIEKSKADAAKADLMYTNNDFRLEKYRNHYWYSGPVMKCDVPRLGIILNPPAGLREAVCSKFGIPAEHKILLYAPTFRKKTNLDAYRFDMGRCLHALEEKFGGAFSALVRLHPNESARAGELLNNDQMSIFNATKYPDMQELLAVCDVLITDYSGCMFDFGVSGKPVFLLAQDLEDYLAKDREAYFRLDQLPFSLSRNIEELITNIESFSENCYLQHCGDFWNSIGLHDSGNGSKVIADLIQAKLSQRE